MRVLLICAAATALLACNREAEVTADNASVAEVAQKVREAGADMRLQPGRWETSVRLESLEAPGMPPQVLDQMKTAMGGQTYASCLTKEEADKPAADFFAGEQANNQCRYDNFRMGDGRISGTLRCTSPQGAAMTMTMDGTYRPGEFAMTQRMETGADGRTMKMTARVNARRTGECKGNEAA